MTCSKELENSLLEAARQGSTRLSLRSEVAREGQAPQGCISMYNGCPAAADTGYTWVDSIVKQLTDRSVTSTLRHCRAM